MAYDKLSSKFIVSGSIVSCMTTFAVLVYCVASRARYHKQASLPYALIANLCLAEFLNTLTTSISGLIHVRSNELHAGPACAASGFFAQITAQAVDFTILAIVLVTLLAVTRLLRLPILSTLYAKLLICLSTWALPLVTSATAMGLEALRPPVGNNWCDLAQSRPGLRYALTDGWRLGIMILTVFLYAFIGCLVYRQRRLCSITNGMEPECEKCRLKRKVCPAPIPSRSPGASESLRADARRGRCSDVSLPLQGYDNAGADFEERERAIASNTETISRWIYLRHPGLINSLKPQVSSPLVTSQSSAGPRITRSFSVTTDLRPPGLSLATSTADPLLDRCSSLQIDSRSQVTALEAHHQPHNLMRSVDVHTDSHYEKARGRCRSVDQVNWPFLNYTSSPAESSGSDRPSSSETTLGLDEQPIRRLSHSHQERQQGAKPPSADMDARLQRPDAEMATRHEGPENTSEMPHHSKRIEAKSSLRGPAEREQRLKPSQRWTTLPSPSYHNRCQEVQPSLEAYVGTAEGQTGFESSRRNDSSRSEDVSMSPPQETKPVTRSISTIPYEPACLQHPSPTYQVPPFYTKTTICTAANELYPSPTASISSPPWKSEPRSQRRRTFLLSKSSWSGSNVSRYSRSPRANNKGRDIRCMLLLSAYPLEYVILGLPWMVNCLMEARGSVPGNARAMYALVGLFQYLGLLNALTFAASERLKSMDRADRDAGTERDTGDKDSSGGLGV